MSYSNILDFDPYCLQYWLPKNIKKIRELTTEVVTCELRIDEILVFIVL